MFTLTSLSRHTATNHPNSLIPRLRLSRWISWASPLSRRLAALFRPNRVHFRCGLSDSFHCSPPRLATTQLSQVSAGVRAPTAQGLSPCRVVTLHSAREQGLKSLLHYSEQAVSNRGDLKLNRTRILKCPRFMIAFKLGGFLAQQPSKRI